MNKRLTEQDLIKLDIIKNDILLKLQAKTKDITPQQIAKEYKTAKDNLNNFRCNPQKTKLERFIDYVKLETVYNYYLEIKTKMLYDAQYIIDTLKNI